MLLDHISLGSNRTDSQRLADEQEWRRSLAEGSIPKPYSNELRARVIDAVVVGASRREAAECYAIGASTVVMWAQRWEETGSFAAKPAGGSTSHSKSRRPAQMRQTDICVGALSTRSRPHCLIFHDEHHPKTARLRQIRQIRHCPICGMRNCRTACTHFVVVRGAYGRRDRSGFQAAR
jgi:hypothetical protein